MSSTLVRGMPYATMVYEQVSALKDDGRIVLPTIASPLLLGSLPIADGGKTRIECSMNSAPSTWINKEVELYFYDSDFSWMVFFSEPVLIQCVSKVKTGPSWSLPLEVQEAESTFLQVVGRTNESNVPLIIRAAVLEQCSTGKNQATCRHGLGYRLPQEPSKEVYRSLLRRHAKFYPGDETSVEYIIDEEKNQAELILNWDVRSMAAIQAPEVDPKVRKSDSDVEDSGLIMFALPHHLDKLDASVLPEGTLYCTSTLHGPSCLVNGGSWHLVEQLPDINFRAPRPPRPEFLPQLASALKQDINYTLPGFFLRGAGDTYFSGKMLAKLGRILLVLEELNELCGLNPKEVRAVDDYAATCKNITLPSAEEMSDAIGRLRSGVEIWINGSADTPFVYDSAWGGVVSCGCDFQENDDDDGASCSNRAPDCPAFSDQGLNFGNGKSIHGCLPQTSSIPGLNK